jgi:hypothetical protein
LKQSDGRRKPVESSGAAILADTAANDDGLADVADAGATPLNLNDERAVHFFSL